MLEEGFVISGVIKVEVSVVSKTDRYTLTIRTVIYWQITISTVTNL